MTAEQLAKLTKHNYTQTGEFRKLAVLTCSHWHPTCQACLVGSPPLEPQTGVTLMATEIERKFLVNGTDWRAAEQTYYCQGYLNRDKHRTVRVRVAGNVAMLTVKGLTTGASREEYEYTIPVEDAKAMLKLCDGPLVEKNRRVIAYGGLNWEVDEFLGDNEGLVVAEVELESETQAIDPPEWVGTEITDDPRYFNSNLSATPFKTWADNSD